MAAKKRTRDLSQDKPPYHVPTMKEVEALPWNGFNVVSTFSGCGGSCLGYRMAGFKVLWASEFIEEAQRTYRANHPTSILDTRDIRDVKPEDILKAIGMSQGQLDLFDGSPPCASFSMAGSREDGWGKEKKYSGKVQRVDDLFWEYIRLVNGVQPKVFIAENVAGMVRGVAKGMFLAIKKELESCGYTVVAKLLDSRWLGVPQARQRVIFQGIRNDLAAKGVVAAYPQPKPYLYTVGEAFENLPKLMTFGRDLKVGTKTRQLWEDVRKDEGSLSGACMRAFGKGGFITHTKVWLDRPAATVLEKNQHYHPIEPRLLTIEEGKRICSFPDDFVFTGTYYDQWERMGRAVPPLMMKGVAEAVRDRVLPKAKALGF